MTGLAASCLRAVEYGWLRRPEKDGRNYDAWEMPNGTMKAVEKGVDPMVLKLEVASLRDLMKSLGGSES